MPPEKTSKNHNPMADVVSRLFKLNVTYGFFSFILIFTVSAAFENAQAGLLITSTALCVLFCCSFYVEAWHYGSRDLGLEKYGRSEFKKMKGAAAGLISQIPGFLAVILAIVFYGEEGPLKYSRLIQQMLYAPFAWLFSVLDGARPYIFLLPVLLMPAFTCAGYIVGHTGKPIFKLTLKNDDDEPAV